MAMVSVAPERLNDMPYDERSDVYSLGVTLYELLTGTVPFKSREGDLWAVAVMHLSKKPEPLRSHAPEIPEGVDEVVLRALAKRPAERPTALELAQLFRAAIEPSAPVAGV